MEKHLSCVGQHKSQYLLVLRETNYLFSHWHSKDLREYKPQPPEVPILDMSLSDYGTRMYYSCILLFLLKMLAWEILYVQAPVYQAPPAQSLSPRLHPTPTGKSIAGRRAPVTSKLMASQAQQKVMDSLVLFVNSMRLSHSHWFKEGKQESKTLQHLVYHLFVSVPTFEIILESIALQCSSLWICLCTVVVELVLLIVIHIDSVVCSGKLAGYISKTHPMVYSWKKCLYVNAGIWFPLGRTGDLVDIILAFLSLDRHQRVGRQCVTFIEQHLCRETRPFFLPHASSELNCFIMFVHLVRQSACSFKFEANASSIHIFKIASQKQYILIKS